MASDSTQSWLDCLTCTGVVLALSLVATPVHAGDDAPVVNKPAATTHAEPATTDPDGLMTRASIRRVIEKETASTQLPADIAEAVVFVESRYDPTVIGGVGEIGLMQVRPETASMLGFRGSTTELARPEVNIHYGVIYLNGAWKLAAGDLCRALMKYRAGHGEEVMTPRSQIYCNRARNRLIAMNSPFASPQPVVATISEPEQPPPVISREKISQEKPSRPPSMRSRDAYAGYARGTAAGSRAFWTAHEARVQRIKARIEARWKRVATR